MKFLYSKDHFSLIHKENVLLMQVQNLFMLWKQVLCLFLNTVNNHISHHKFCVFIVLALVYDYFELWELMLSSGMTERIKQVTTTNTNPSSHINSLGIRTKKHADQPKYLIRKKRTEATNYRSFSEDTRHPKGSNIPELFQIIPW